MNEISIVYEIMIVHCHYFYIKIEHFPQYPVIYKAWSNFSIYVMFIGLYIYHKSGYFCCRLFFSDFAGQLDSQKYFS